MPAEPDGLTQATPNRMKRPAFLALGVLSVALGVVGIFLPLLPTVPFMLLAAWAFGRAHPAWEQRLLDHPRYGPHIRAWRQRGAIPLRAKQASVLMLSGSAVMGLLALPGWWKAVPAGIAVLVALWIVTRPTA